LPTRTLLYVSVRHTFINLTSFLGIPSSTRILYKTLILYKNIDKFGRNVESYFSLSELRNTGKTMRSVIRFTQTISFTPHLLSPLLSFSYSERTSGGFSCDFPLLVLSDALCNTATNSACQLIEHEVLRLLFNQV